MKFVDKVKKVFGSRKEVDLTQSALSPSQAIEYINATGNNDFLDFYGIGTGHNAAIHFAVFFRIINLLSSVIAQLMTTGGLKIVNKDGEIDKSKGSMDLLELLQHTPDGETPAFQFISDLAADYLIDGNALLSIQRVGSRVSSLRRLESFSAQIEPTNSTKIVYKAHDAYATEKTEGDFETFADIDIIHPRWCFLGMSRQGINRSRFAPSPVKLMRPALSIGLESDKYILDWYKTDSPKSNVGISIQKPLQSKQLDEFHTQFEKAAKSRAPLLFGEGATFTNLNNSSSGNATQAVQREFQVGEICRIYGVPGPLVNQQVTSWGSGIEQLSKMFYRFGLRQHIEAILAPMKMKLLPKGFQFSIDDTDLLRGDTAGISAILTATRGDAQTQEIATTEERRRMVGLPIKPEYGELTPLRTFNNEPPSDGGIEEDEGVEDNPND